MSLIQKNSTLSRFVTAFGAITRALSKPLENGGSSFPKRRKGDVTFSPSVALLTKNILNTFHVDGIVSYVGMYVRYDTICTISTYILYH